MDRPRSKSKRRDNCRQQETINFFDFPSDKSIPLCGKCRYRRRPSRAHAHCQVCRNKVCQNCVDVQKKWALLNCNKVYKVADTIEDSEKSSISAGEDSRAGSRRGSGDITCGRRGSADITCSRRGSGDITCSRRGSEDVRTTEEEDTDETARGLPVTPRYNGRYKSKLGKLPVIAFVSKVSNTTASVEPAQNNLPVHCQHQVRGNEKDCKSSFSVIHNKENARRRYDVVPTISVTLPAGKTNDAFLNSRDVTFLVEPNGDRGPSREPPRMIASEKVKIVERTGAIPRKPRRSHKGLDVCQNCFPNSENRQQLSDRKQTCNCRSGTQSRSVEFTKHRPVKVNNKCTQTSARPKRSLGISVIDTKDRNDTDDESIVPCCHRKEPNTKDCERNSPVRVLDDQKRNSYDTISSSDNKACCQKCTHCIRNKDTEKEVPKLEKKHQEQISDHETVTVARETSSTQGVRMTVVHYDPSKPKPNVREATVHREVKAKTSSQGKTIFIKTESDENDCDISGMALLSDNELVLADKSNQKLKVLDLERHNVTLEIPTNANMGDLCVIPPRGVAVTMPEVKAIKLISVENGSCVEAGVIDCDRHCLGVAYCKERLIVSFVEPAGLKIFNLSGDVMMTCTNANDVYIHPQCVSICRDETNFYICDPESNIVTMVTMDGSISCVYAFKDGWFPLCVQAISDYVFIACSSTLSTIRVITDDVKNGRLLTKDIKLVSKPKRLCYCPVRKHLYVTSARHAISGGECNILRVLNV